MSIFDGIKNVCSEGNSYSDLKSIKAYFLFSVNIVVCLCQYACAFSNSENTVKFSHIIACKVLSLRTELTSLKSSGVWSKSSGGSNPSSSSVHPCEVLASSPLGDLTKHMWWFSSWSFPLPQFKEGERYMKY